MAFLVFCILLFPSLSFSQHEYESDVPSRETEEQAKARQAAVKARELAALEGPEVTYEQVLNDPDNIELNFNYAKIQIARGNLKGASATLERLLLVDPTLAQVRLLYGIVLFRLDNIDEAERMLLSVREMKITGTLRDDVDLYLKEIRMRRKRTHWLASATFGGEYDTNRNAAPSSKKRVISDTPVPLEGTSVKRPDSSMLGIESLKVTQDIGSQAGHQLYASVDHFIQQQTRVHALNLTSYSAEAGGIFKIGPTVFTPSLKAGHILLSNETFLRTQGGELRLDGTLTQKAGLTGRAEWTREDYSGISESSAAGERKGHRVTAEIGGNYLLNPTMRVELTGDYIKKYAKAAYYEYEGYAAQVGHTWLLGKGQFLTNTGSFELDDYDDPDFSISSKTRRDKLYRWRVTYGAPVTLFTGKKLLPNWVTDNLTATVIYEFTRSVSNITNYTYTNAKTAALLTKTVEF